MLSKKNTARNTSELDVPVQLIALPYAAGSFRSYYSLKKVWGIDLINY